MGIEEQADARLAARLAELRVARGWTLEELARRADVSRSTLSRLERGEISPTAALLGRLCAVHERTMSRLLAEVEAAPSELVRAEEQPEWTDPATGFVRRAVSPPHRALRAEVIRSTLPAGARIDYPAPPVVGLEHHVWMLEGLVEITVDGRTHRLAPGDCLRFRLWGASGYHCPGPERARYVVVTVPA